MQVPAADSWTRPSRHPSVRRGPASRRRFVKVARGSAGRADLAHEAAAYASLAPLAGGGGLLPAFERWDPERGELVLEELDGRDLGTVVLDSGAFPPGLGGPLGTALARVHAAPAAEDLGRARPRVTWHTPSPADLARHSFAGRQLLVAVQARDAAMRLLDGPGELPPDGLVHGDLRLENVVVLDTPGVGALRIVDWECAGAGEAAWDVACVLAGGLAAAIDTVPHVPGVAPSELEAEATVTRGSVLPGLHAFWSSYRAAAPAGRPVDLERAVVLMGLRLADLALESTQDHESPRDATWVLLQLGLNVLADPDGAASTLLGLTR